MLELKNIQVRFAAGDHAVHAVRDVSLRVAKGEIFGGLMPGGTAIINRDTPHFERLKAHAVAASASRIVSSKPGRRSAISSPRASGHPSSLAISSRKSFRVPVQQPTVTCQPSGVGVTKTIPEGRPLISRIPPLRAALPIAM